MPPKRRPAAAKAGAKARPKAKAKVKAAAKAKAGAVLPGILKRPGMRVRIPGRRSSRATDPEILNSKDITLEACKNLTEVEIIEGTFWEGAVDGVVKVDETKLSNGEVSKPC